MKAILPILFVLFLLIAKSHIILAQDQPLPIYETQQEKALSSTFKTPKASLTSITTPPVGSIRNPAEWEEMQGVAISWKDYSSFLTEIVRYAVDEAKVYIYTTNPTTVQNALTNAGISLTNVIIVNQATNSVWIRDYGANNVYKNDVEDLLFSDWIYNRKTRPADNSSPEALATLLNVPYYQMIESPNDLVNTGGNFMSDGFGNAFASKLILDENDSGNPYNVSTKTEAQIDTILKQYLGINRYVKMETLPYDGIHHIDMHMKLLDEETILVGQYPEGIADGPQIDTNIQYILNNYNSIFGTPYKIVRIPMPPDPTANLEYPDESGYYLTYTNSLILNKSVLVPIYNFEQYDTTALRIYRQAMPGYKIIGIDATDPIAASGTIHCTSHEIAAVDPLLISHQRLNDVNVTVSSYTVNALIQHRTGIASATVHYKNHAADTYVSTATMSLTTNNIWSGSIPAQNSGDSVYYYIEAHAVSGKTQVRPMPAPAGYWAFKVFGTSGIDPLTLSNLSVEIIGSNLISNNLSISINCDLSTYTELAIYDLLGKKLKTIYNGNINNGKSYFNTSIDELSKGMYFLVARTKSEKITKKFIVK